MVVDSLVEHLTVVFGMFDPTYHSPVSYTNVMLRLAEREWPGTVAVGTGVDIIFVRDGCMRPDRCPNKGAYIQGTATDQESPGCTRTLTRLLLYASDSASFQQLEYHFSGWETGLMCTIEISC